jgi:hypothetical protein
MNVDCLLEVYSFCMELDDGFDVGPMAFDRLMMTHLTASNLHKLCILITPCSSADTPPPMYTNCCKSAIPIP